MGFPRLRIPPALRGERAGRRGERVRRHRRARCRSSRRGRSACCCRAARATGCRRRSSIPARSRRRSRRAPRSASFRSPGATSQALEMPLYAGEDVGEGSLQQRALDGLLEAGGGLVQARLVVDQQPRLMRGRFITFEGGEGAGKSTQIARLAAPARGARASDRRRRASRADRRRRKHIRAVHPRADAPRRSGPCAEALLFYAARLDHLETLIRPALAARRAGALRPVRGFDPRLSGRLGRGRPRLLDALDRDRRRRDAAGPDRSSSTFRRRSASPAPRSGAGRRGGRPLRGGGARLSRGPAPRLSATSPRPSPAAASSSTATASADAVEEAVCRGRAPRACRTSQDPPR